MNPTGVTEQNGINRTGMQVSPAESEAMLDVDGMSAGEDGTDEAQIDMRGSYIEDADPVGTAPSEGIADLLLDKLGERMAFERTGTRLYDALITKCSMLLDDADISMTIAELTEIRDDEARHFLMLADAIESLGGDPTTQTPCADLAGVESMGLGQVINDPRTTIAQSLHAILIAELADNSGWEILIALAGEQGQQELVDDFSEALDKEREHLSMIQAWYQESLGITASSELEYDDDDDELRPAP